MRYFFRFLRQLYQGWAEPFDLVTMKLLIFHVSEHRDENLVRPLWNRIFDESEENFTFHPGHNFNAISGGFAALRV